LDVESVLSLAIVLLSGMIALAAHLPVLCNDLCRQRNPSRVTEFPSQESILCGSL